MTPLFRLCIVPDGKTKDGLFLLGIKIDLKREVLSRFKSLSPEPTLLIPHLEDWIQKRSLLFKKTAALTTIESDLQVFRDHLHRTEAAQGIYSCEKSLGHLDTPPNKVTFFDTPEKLEDLILANALSKAIDLHDHSNPNAPLRETTKARREKLLLHVCCGPDAAGVIEQLQKNFEVTAFWYDPNIQPQEEHDLRLHAFEKVCELLETPYIVGEYDADRFLTTIKGLEHTPEQGAKCSLCYDMRLERAALEAKTQSSEYYATTLAISPHKVQEKLIKFGQLMEKRFGVPYYHENFMKSDGFKHSVDFTREHSIYRQDYCGCWFSLHEGGPAAQAYSEAKGHQFDQVSDPQGWAEYQENISRLAASGAVANRHTG